MNDYQQKLVAHLKGLPLEKPPAPWRYVRFVHVGGLEAVGYGEASDLLLIVSVSGRSVTDCQTGSRLARAYPDTAEESAAATWYRTLQLLAEGIGPLTGQMIRVGGIHGGGLPIITADSWYLDLVAPDWPNSFILLHGPSFVDGQRVPEEKVKIAPAHGQDDVVLTYGFSPTGNSFVVAYSGGVDIFARIE
jgi:hypothetical protein